MEFNRTDIQGCYLITPFSQADERGEFVKFYNSEAYAKNDLNFEIKEIYYSTSKKNVLRGFHFQTPPADHTKIVNCFTGAIADFVLDIRVESPTYGKCIVLELSASNKQAVYIPKGCAHGFLSLEDNTIVTYLQETVYNPQLDSGILWSSIDIPYEITNPTLSSRDQEFPSFQQFKSPF
ncbi:MAG: dTDP-4-dehydrorhamnose 3,5-epimerase family protein [Ekhidna sp.]